jgi:hypothetical protein
VKISKAYVYRVRALETPVAQQPAKLGRRLGNRADSRPDPRSEQRLTSLALEIGLMRANLLLDRVRARLGQ